MAQILFKWHAFIFLLFYIYSMANSVNIVWLRRDLRLFDNHSVAKAQDQGSPLLFLFIFDKEILDKLEDKDDARVTFIYQEIEQIKKELQQKDSDILVKYGKPAAVWKEVLKEFSVNKVFANLDYEPYAKQRDEEIKSILAKQDIDFDLSKDQVIFHKQDILSGSGTVYKVYTPFKNKWLEKFSDDDLPDYGTVKKSSLHKINKALPLPSLADMGFKKSSLEFPARKIDDKLVKNYAKTRDYPYDDKTSRLGIHLRFGTISIRQLIRQVKELSAVYLQELIWREFFMYILENNPRVVEEAYDSKFSDIPWKNSEKDFELWCQGKTGVPLVDAGMRQLNQTGFMHNRIRMVCASFLTRNLLIDWRWGEAYFARKLLDYELANNNGGWQWAAGTGVDAQPYFRVFNPESQADKYDKDRKYIKDWIPEWGTKDYPEPIVDLKESRKNAIDTYKEVANKS